MPSLLDLNGGVTEQPKKASWSDDKIRWSDYIKGPATPKETLDKLALIDKPIPERKRSTDDYLNQLITQHESMLRAKQLARLYASEKHPVLVSGPTGTGKEILSRALHGTRQGKFVAVNCGGFPEYLVDSILFGHIRGAFTGADKSHTGVFESAAAGTVFLDEVAELPLHMQAKLLRVLQEREFYPVGGGKLIRTDARVICATNKKLFELVNDGSFREDLYWRISTLEIVTTGLSTRKADIALYVEHHKMSANTRLQEMIAEELKKLLCFTGNYRQLSQMLIRSRIETT